MYWEAKGVTEFLLADSNLKNEESVAIMVHAIACLLVDRPDLAAKDLANPLIGSNYDAQLWRALTYARQEKWAEAREKFKNVEFAIASLPLDLQRIVTADAMRASLEVKDYAGAAKRRAELDVIGVPAEQKATIAVLRGRLAEALGNEKDALDEYAFAGASSDRQAAAEAKQLEIALKQKRDEIRQADALRELETLSAVWRGDAVEVKTLQMLSLIYNVTARYPESLAAARTATRLRPNSEASRAAQDNAQALFSEIFLTRKGDDLPPIDALGMFYEFRELTPIGRRGDEMIRRLADRLVAVDLLDVRRNYCNTRSITASRARRGHRSRQSWRWSISPATSPILRSAPFAPVALPIFPASCASSGSCSRRAPRATSGATTSRSTSFPISRVARRSGCARTSTGQPGAGANPPNRSSSITEIAGATSSR